MITTFQISGNFPLQPDFAKSIIRFCIFEARKIGVGKLNRNLPKQMLITMKRGGWDGCRSGRATRNNNRILRSHVYLRLADYVPPHLEQYHRYKHREDCPAIWIGDAIEMFVHLTAHELGHAIIGFEGDRIGEYQCERFAARVLETWRIQFIDPACLI